MQSRPQLIPAGLLVTVLLAAPAPALITVRVKVSPVKVAVTLLAALIVTWQVREVLLLHSLGAIVLVHPAKVDPVCAAAVSVTTVPVEKVEVSERQAAPQLIPAGLLVTVPVPVPALTMVRELDGAKYAVTFLAPVIVIWQVIPVQSPPQPTNTELTPAVAVSVTTVFDAKTFAQAAGSVGQLIPTGLLVTLPLEPVAACTLTDSSFAKLNRASTVLAVSIVTTQAPVPLHGPPHPINSEPTVTEALSVTSVLRA